MTADDAKAILAALAALEEGDAMIGRDLIFTFEQVGATEPVTGQVVERRADSLTVLTQPVVENNHIPIGWDSIRTIRVHVEP